MSEVKDKDESGEAPAEDKPAGKKTLSLGGSKGTLSLKGGGAPATARARSTMAQGRTGPAVAVEVRRRRGPAAAEEKPEDEDDAEKSLTDEEREARLQALRKAEEDAQRRMDEDGAEEKADTPRRSAPGRTVRSREEHEEELRKIREEQEQLRQEQETQAAAPAAPKQDDRQKRIEDADAAEEESYRKRMKRAPVAPRKTTTTRRGGGKLTVTQVLNQDYEKDRGPSLAAQRRAKEKARLAGMDERDLPDKVAREVIVPETITVQELANRMAERSGDVIKSLMKMGVMATVNQAIDADTAELLIDEFGHTIRRVTDADVEVGIEGPEDDEKDLQSRPPVVTIMGHVDHGKTSLLDALRTTDVVSGEAGGITQHIGAYQVTLQSGDKITFLDTPGHAAFTEMRARGANVTDIVVLVVAANDGLMPQTIEAISHAKAAEVPIIVAINKIDLPEANPQKVKNELLSHELIPEDMGGDVQCIEISALEKRNLDKLEEAILLQAEILELKANPDRDADGTVIEAKLEQGRGHVATVLVERGTLRVGDIFVVGSEFGKVRALIDDHGNSTDQAIPGQPVEILGLDGGPEAGDKLVVVEDEARAREIADYRGRKKREAAAVVLTGPTSLEDLMARTEVGERKEFGIIVKGDVHGSVEAIVGALKKIEEENEDVHLRILHAGAGGITESDVTLAGASGGLIIGFNVRANAQARDLAEKTGTDVRYYNIIYNVIDDVKAVLGGLLEPVKREEYLGQAEIQQVFRVSKVGNVAGCIVKLGSVKRGAGVRLLRDDVVIHEGTLKTLKRFKDEVPEVKEGTECGMAFQDYDDIKEGDVIECYEVVEEARTVA